MKLGNRIMSLRKAKNMTQEALARELGVSAPAISKWETDSSLPDVTLLCPLARALGTDLNTLFSYEEALSDRELSDIGRKLRDMAYAGQGYKAEEELAHLLRIYPSDVRLKLSAIAIYNILWSVTENASEEDAARWTERKKELAQWIYDSKDPNYHEAAVSMLVSIALGENALDKAEALIQETEKASVDLADLTMLKVSLCLKKGDKEQAMQILKRQQTMSVGRLLNAMMGMLREDMEADKEKILLLCRQMQTIEKMFHIENPSYGAVYAESYIRAGEYEKALDYLEGFVFNAGPEIKPVILRALSLDDCFAPIRKESRFIRLMDGLKKEA